MSLDITWEEAKQQLRTEFDRLWEENGELRISLELAQQELRNAARDGGILALCPICGYRDAQ